MSHRDTITQEQLSALPHTTPVALIGSEDGYGALIGEFAAARWLHTTSGQFKLFKTIDRAAALLRACGITRFTVDTQGGTPQ